MNFFKNKNLKFLILGLFFSFAIFSLFTFPVLAQNTDTSSTLGINTVDQDIALGSSDLRTTVVRIINTVLGLLGIVAVGIVLYGGFIYMTAGGDEGKVSTARKILINGIIGLVIILSAFAITKFILNKLSEATGLRDGTNIDTTSLGDCYDTTSVYYQLYADTSVCNEEDICLANHFVVQSITPNTTSTDFVGMNNVVIRTVFSREVGSQLANAIKITQNGDDVTGKFNLSFIEDKHAIQAVPTTQDGCDASSDKLCLSKGKYDINILEVLDTNGNALEVETDCGTYPKDASFYVGDETNFIDSLAPNLDILLDGQSGDNINLVAGYQYDLNISSNDRKNVVYGGNSFVSLNIYKDSAPATILKSYLLGPAISLGSSLEFNFNYKYRVPPNLETNVEYILDVVAHDIDNNVVHKLIKFKVIPATCANGVKDAGETGIDTGGNCPGGLGDSCKTQLDCSTSYKCLDSEDNLCTGIGECVCKKWPYIESVNINENDQSQMDGAVGNWITISGRNFGNTEGEINFNYDINNDGVFDYARVVSLAQCRSNDVWNDNWIIAEVPAEDFDRDIKPVISVKNLELSSSSNEDRNNLLYASSLSSGRVLNLHLDETSGDIVDSSGLHNDMEVFGEVTYANDGKFGKAIGFEKDGDYQDTSVPVADPNSYPYKATAGYLRMSVPAGSPLDLSKGSVFAWIKKSTSSVYSDTIVARGTTFGLFVTGSKLSVGEWYPQGGRIINSDADVVDGTWHQVGLVFDRGVENGTKLYVDGQLVLTTTTQSNIGNTGYLLVGANNSGEVMWYTGLIDEVNIWNRVLSDDEINSLYNTTAVGYKFTDFSNDNFGKNLGPFTYNDTNRPGLCSVKVSDESVNNGASSAEPKTVVQAVGKSFGELSSGNSLIFGQTSAGINSWTSEIIMSTVPFAGVGKNAVYVQLGGSDGQRSNPVWFNVLPSGANNDPIITSISPASVTPGSYITINGRNFGSNQGSGKVTIGVLETDDLPLYCGITWTDTQIITKVSTTTPFGKDVVSVTIDDGKNTGDNNFVNVIQGAPAPSICKLEPDKGPAPLSNGKYLKLSGENFGTSTPTAYFWKDNAVVDITTTTENTWFNTSTFHSYSNTELEVAIPFENGISMSSGPIVVKVNDIFSNGIKYEVEDCRLSTDAIPSGFQCCPSGREAGKLKVVGAICLDTARTGGYVWRFTTGKFQEKFLVLEQCIDGVVPPVPSPTPWSTRKQGKITCVNAQIQASFSLPIDYALGNLANFRIFTCADNNGNIDCSDATEVTGQFTIDVSNSQTVVFKKIVGDLEANKWYNVVMSKDLQSLEKDVEAGHDIDKNFKIEATRKCTISGVEYAYCFDFKTGGADDICTLVGAGIDPSLYETNLLGIIQDIRWSRNYILDEIFNINKVKPQYFDVYGIGNQECVVLNVDNEDWQWGPINYDSLKTATAERIQKNSRAFVTAWKNNPGGSDVFARLDIVDEGHPVQGNYDLLDIAQLDTNDVIDNMSKVKSISDDEGNYSLLGDFKFDVEVNLGNVIPLGSIMYTVNRQIIYKGNNYSLYVNESGVADADNYLPSSRVLVFSSNDVILPSISLSVTENTFGITVERVGDVVTMKADGRTVTANISVNQVDSSPIILGNTDNNNHDNDEYVYNPNFLYGTINTLNFSNNISSFDVTSIQATSTIKIDLGDPKIIDRWPACTEACVNAEIGAQFNQIMIPSTYNNGIKLYKCASESCDGEVGDGLEIIDFVMSDGIDANMLKLYSDNYLATSTWYLVTASSSIHASGGLDGDNQIDGNPLTATEWKFKTKSSAEPCVIDTVDIIPNPFSAYYIGQQKVYRAAPRGAVDSCSPYGQALDPWDYGWEWSVQDTNVASTTDFSISGKHNNFCTQNCLPKGSDVSYNVFNANYAVCGNGVVDAGEDCDIAREGETAGVNCTYNCLRPGVQKISDGGSCGNSQVDSDLGEECDPTSSSLNESRYCSDTTCLWIGSSNEATGDVNAPICGSGETTTGEDCDGEKGCSNICLHTGTNLFQKWCDISDRNSTVTACKNALSICGNSIIESGEECEIGINDATSATCSSSCLLQNVCGIDSLSQCNKDAMGCSADCTLAGSSLSYREPTICGDGVVSFGEAGDIDYNGEGGSYSCELTDGGHILGGSPSQIITSVGTPGSADPTQIIADMTTKIFAKPVKYYDGNGNPTSTKSDTVRGEGDYSLMCGYTEFSEIKDTEYNNCPNNSDNTLGVGTNSCCYYRPIRSGQYPTVNAGIPGSGTEAVCRNTYLEVEFPVAMNKVSFNDNVTVVEGYDQAGSYRGYNCATNGQIDVTSQMNGYLGIDPQLSIKIGFWKNIWLHIKSFFANLFAGKVFAEPVRPNNALTEKNIVWCQTKIGVEPNPQYVYKNVEGTIVTSTRVNLSLSETFDPNVYVVMMLSGGKDGIKDSYGVGIKNPYFDKVNDYWLFKTGSDICKIKDIAVVPPQYVFTKPNSSQNFAVNIISNTGGQLISPIPGFYDWRYSWSPTNNAIFTIPNTSSSTINISSKDVEGEIDGLAQVQVIADSDTVNSQLGNVFTKNFKLIAFFCSNPWPTSNTNITGSSGGSVDVSNGLLEDNKYNFSFIYCADNNNPLTITDDLPLFENVQLIGNNLDDYGVGDTALRRYLLFSEDTNDALGIQVFENTPSSNGSIRSLENWYTDKFDMIGSMKSTSLAGYDALTDGNNYYVSVFDVDKSNGGYGTVYNYIILFSITNNYSQDTSKVFEQIVDNLKFNTKMTNYNKCLGISEQAAYETEISTCRDKGNNGKFYCNGGITAPVACTGPTDQTCKSYGDSICEKIGESQYFCSLIDDQPISCTKNSDCASFTYQVEVDPEIILAEPSVIRTGVVENNITDIDCNTDFDCRDNSGAPLVNTSGYCNNEKTKFYRDLNRLASLRVTQNNLDNYFTSDSDKNDFVGDLESGSFIPGYSTSKWQNSWGLLNSYTGSIAVDPINQWVGCSDHDPLTCWNTTSSTFKCPTFSQVYEYNFVSSTTSYEVYAPFEYLRSEGDSSFISRYINQDKIKFGGYCVPETTVAYSAASNAICGDGVINTAAGEQCEPPNLSRCDNNKIVKCNANSCTWDSVADSCDALLNKSCGNGRLDGTYSDVDGNSVTEECDDGSLNGRYGHCDNNCQRPGSGSYSGPGYCGDGDYQEQYEYCEKTEEKYQTGFCENKKDLACSSDSECKVDEGEMEVATSFCINNSLPVSFCKGKEGVVGCDPTDKSDNVCASYTYDKIVLTDYGDCKSLDDPNYDFSKANSCSYDCSTAGGYCGDGITQWDFEQCDDSNTNNDDACKNNCTLPTVSGGQAICGNGFVEDSEQCDGGEKCTSECKIEQIKAICGDSLIAFDDKNGNSTKDDGELDIEECDLGPQNGIQCTPGYGQSCNYCSATCMVQTKESVQRCGNGVVDFNDKNGNGIKQDGEDWLEVCDVDSSGQVWGRDGVKSCSAEGYDKGLYICTNNCQNIPPSSCIACNIGENKPLPQIAIINPMVIGGNADYTPQPHFVLYKERPDKTFSTMTTTTSFGALSAWGKINYQGGAFVSSSVQHDVITKSNAAEFLSQPTLGIETNSQCSYKLFFNPNFIGLSLSLQSKLTSGVLGDLFDYPVNNETGVVNNEIIMSPAVPPAYIRVVVRWKRNGNIKFAGNFYSDKVSPDFENSYRYSYAESVEGLWNAMGEDLGGTHDTTNIDSVKNNYVYPTVKPGFGFLGYSDDLARFYFHPIIITDYSGTQATTFYASTHRVNSIMPSSTLGFYVSSPNAPINQLKNNDVWVEVYHYQQGQVNMFSIYKPDFPFSLSDAKPSSNELANYWHVFNIHMDSGNITITPVGSNDIPENKSDYFGYMLSDPFRDLPNYAGSIVTGECGVRAGMPNTTPCEY